MSDPEGQVEKQDASEHEHETGSGNGSGNERGCETGSEAIRLFIPFLIVCTQLEHDTTVILCTPSTSCESVFS